MDEVVGLPKSLEVLCTELDAALAENAPAPEDVERRLALLQPILNSVSRLPRAPDAGGQQTLASRIAALLWFKAHPQQADLDWLLAQLEAASHPIVRVTVLEALRASLREGNARFTSRTGYRARQLFNSLKNQESSPLIRLELQELADEAARAARAAQPRETLRTNPYVAGLPVRGDRYFFGRQDVLSEISQTLKQPGVKSIILHGARRTGKTSILYRLQDGALGPDYFAVYMDMQGQAGKTLDDFLHSLVVSVRNAVFDKNRQFRVPPPDVEARGLLASLGTFLRWALHEIGDQTLLLLLDEYELLQDYFRDSQVASQMQHLLEHEPRLCIIFAGSKKVEALDVKGFLFLLDVSRYIKISFLGREATLQLITEGSGGALRFEQDVVEKVYGLSGGHPYYTQLICQALFELAGTSGVVTEEHLARVAREFVSKPSPHLVLSWKALSLDMKVIASSLAEVQKGAADAVEPTRLVAHLRGEKYPARIGRAEVQESLGALREIDWVEKQTGLQCFRFTMEIVRIWVADNYGIWDLVEEQRRLVAQRLPRSWRREVARDIDVGLPAVLAVGVLWRQPAAGLLVMLFPPFYFIGSMLATRTTLGLRLLRLEVLNAIGARLSAGRAALHGALSAVPLTLLLGGLEVLRVTTGDALAAVGVAAMLGFLALEVPNSALIYFGSKHQTLPDKATGAVVVTRSDK